MQVKFRFCPKPPITISYSRKLVLNYFSWRVGWSLIHVSTSVPVLIVGLMSHRETFHDANSSLGAGPLTTRLALLAKE